MDVERNARKALRGDFRAAVADGGRGAGTALQAARR
jgi:hypothetical protein